MQETLHLIKSVVCCRGAAAIVDSQWAADSSHSDIVGTASARGPEGLGDSVCNYNTGKQRCCFTWFTLNVYAKFINVNVLQNHFLYRKYTQQMVFYV